MQAVDELSTALGVVQACAGLDVPRSLYYRAKRPPRPKPKTARPPSPRALSNEERREVLAALNSERFRDQAPAEIYAALLDEGVYVCSERTMYRILQSEGQAKERRDQQPHPPYATPRLAASAPNQVWSWDITKLRGPGKWTYYHLYVILDIFSRYAVGWMVAERESAELAKHLVEESYLRQGIEKKQLTLHADRGAAMRSQPLACLLSDLGVSKSHSRPRVSNDNPYSESQFKTMKYRPEFPERFASVQEARAFGQEFFRWYNEEHHHSGLEGLTPAMVHYGKVDRILRERQAVLSHAYERHPERFVRRPPRVEPLPETVWINRPEQVIEPQPLLSNFSIELSHPR
jgi:putative transposase